MNDIPKKLDLSKWVYISRQVDLPPLVLIEPLPNKNYSAETAKMAVTYIYEKHPSLFLDVINFCKFINQNPKFSIEEYFAKIGINYEEWTFFDQIVRIFVIDLHIRGGGAETSVRLELMRQVRAMLGINYKTFS